jgi:hypothetical protein
MDEFIGALETILEILPDAATVRRYAGDELDDAPMTPEEFIDFTRELLDASKRVRKKYE